MSAGRRVAVIGGGGIRVPLLLNGLLRRAAEIDLEEIRLHDVDTSRVSLMQGLGEALRRRHGASVRIVATEELDATVSGVSFVFSAVRIGGADGRIKDERIPLQHGLLGQETTGIGGMSMALRTIPFALHLAERVEALAPGAWFLNFTNPSGLIVEALHRGGHRRTIGLCDAPSGLKTEVCRFLDVPEERCSLRYQGLNHLGWVQSVAVDGRERMGALLSDAARLCAEVRSLGFFGADLLQGLGLLPNEYLYYYYFRRAGLAREIAAQRTRGEQVKVWNNRIYREVGEALGQGGEDEAIARYRAVLAERRNSYMSDVTDTRHDRGITSDTIFREEGYEGLALKAMSALAGGPPTELVLNVASQGASDFLAPDEVGELSCRIDSDGAHPLPTAPLPPGPRGLARSVKDYEVLCAQAAVSGSREMLLQAAQVHPLIGDRSAAQACIDELIEAHRQYLPQFA